MRENIYFEVDPMQSSEEMHAFNMDWMDCVDAQCQNGRQTISQTEFTPEGSERIDPRNGEVDDQQFLFGNCSEWYSQVGHLEGILNQLDNHLESGQLLASELLCSCRQNISS